MITIYEVSYPNEDGVAISYVRYFVDKAEAYKECGMDTDGDRVPSGSGFRNKVKEINVWDKGEFSPERERALALLGRLSEQDRGILKKYFNENKTI